MRHAYINKIICKKGNLKAASGVYSATIMMEMRKEVIGRLRESSAVGSRRNIREGHLSCYYTIVKREVICVNEEVKSDMW